MARPPQCVECKLAEWHKTAAGRLHPSGNGRCKWQMPEIRPPVSMYFLGSMQPSGGFINRRDEWKQCPQFQKGASQ